jgi:hypothetical protein
MPNFGFPLKLPFFKNEKRKRLATWQEQAGKGFKCMDEPSWSFGQNWKPNYTSLYPRLKENIDSGSN